MHTSSIFVLTVVATAFLSLLIPALLFPNRMLNWFRRKRYQYEVTFGLYMMTPTEKFILNSFLFLSLSLVLLGSFLYLPSHISTISHRGFYYYSGSTTSHFASHPFSATYDAVAAVLKTHTSSKLLNTSRRMIEEVKDLTDEGAQSFISRVVSATARGETVVTPSTVAAMADSGLRE